MDDLNVGEVRVKVGLLQLPVELRLEIYRHLLHAEYVYEAAPCPQIKLDTAILGVCHQVRAEASKILYDENRWILVKRNWLGGEYAKDIQECGLPIISPGAAMHIHTFALRIYMDLNDESGDPGTLETIVIAYSEDGLRELCRTVWLASLYGTMDILVFLDEPCGTPRSIRHEKLLAPLSHVRGVRTALTHVHGSESHPQAKALKEIMEDGVWTWTQVMDRLTKDIQEGDARSKLGNVTMAESSYRKAVVFMSEFSDNITLEVPFDRWAADDYKVLTTRFAALEWEVYYKHCLLASRLGKFESAVESAENALLYPGLPDTERARMHHSRGISHLGLHNDIEAAKDFFYAHQLRPMDEPIKQQLGMVEGRLGMKMTEEIESIQITRLIDRQVWMWHGDPRIIQHWGTRGLAQFNGRRSHVAESIR